MPAIGESNVCKSTKEGTIKQQNWVAILHAIAVISVKLKMSIKKLIYLFVYQYSNPTKRGLLASSVKTSKQNK